MNRILFFVHYNKYNGLADYVLYLLEHIRHLYNRIVFISNSPLVEESRLKLNGLSDELIIRENKGFDFGAWKDALLKEGWDTLAGYDSVTLMNDTCFGPLFDFEICMEQMEKRAIDFWGLTIHQKTPNGMPGTNRVIPEHIQSYFLCFNQNIICSPVFQSFWKNVVYLVKIEQVTQYYEIQLTSLLSTRGVKYDAVYRPNIPENYQNKDDATWHPDLIIKNNLPFIKIKSFIYFPHARYIINLIQKKTKYPVELIYNYTTEMFNPNESLQIYDRLIPAVNNASFIPTMKIAVHLHVFYTDIFERYANFFNNISFNFDLFITTDSIDKENAIRKYIKNSETEKLLKEIIIVENRGRDILPWLKITDRLTRYDIVGHFHTKKTIYCDEWHGITWLDEYFQLLFNPINTIIENFQRDSKIGIIIPEFPFLFHINPYLFKDDNEFNNMLEHLWNRMNCKKQIQFTKLDTIIMSYGTMFWYRPSALRSIFKLNLSNLDFTAEPIGDAPTMAHCLERILVYVAWNDGFDYRIMTSANTRTSSFFDNMILNQKYFSIQAATRQTITYRVGEFVLAVPKFLKKIIARKDK